MTKPKISLHMFEIVGAVSIVSDSLECLSKCKKQRMEFCPFSQSGIVKFPLMREPYLFFKKKSKSILFEKG